VRDASPAAVSEPHSAASARLPNDGLRRRCIEGCLGIERVSPASCPTYAYLRASWEREHLVTYADRPTLAFVCSLLQLSCAAAFVHAVQALLLPQDERGPTVTNREKASRKLPSGWLSTLIHSASAPLWPARAPLARTYDGF
jgi:hypothetical protein